MALRSSSGHSHPAIAARYGVLPKHVSDVLSGVARGHQGLAVPTVAAAASAADRWIAEAADGDVERAWLAGLLEGEGSFGCGQRHTVLVRLTMTDQDVVERVARMLGASVRREEPAKDNWAPTWHFEIYGRRAMGIAEDLEPLMGQRRRAQIRKMREYYRPPKRFAAPPSRVVRNLEIARRHCGGESGPALAAEFGMTHQNVYYIARRYRDRVTRS
jgi:LAGLIDADG-like domain